MMKNQSEFLDALDLTEPRYDRAATIARIKRGDAQAVHLFYLDWSNNFLTVPALAEYYRVTVEQAEKLIEAGRAIHERVQDAIHATPEEPVLW